MAEELDENTELVKHPDGYYIKRQKFSTRSTQLLPYYEYKAPDRHIKKSRKMMEDIVKYFAQGKSITTVCQLVDITPTTLRHWRKNDERFNQACIDAIDVETDNQETELQERILRGTRKEIYNGDGELERTEYQQNDQLLLRSLSARRPEKWKAQGSTNVNIAQNSGNVLNSINIDFKLSVAELAKLGHVNLVSEYMAMLDNERKLIEDQS
jgi:transposase-like protein